MLVNPSAKNEFTIESLTLQNLDHANLYYNWYYDWNENLGITDLSSTCTGKSKCTIVVCDKKANTLDTHRLLAVVSSAAPIGDTAPTDFPPGTVYDAVEWQLVRKQACP